MGENVNHGSQIERLQLLKAYDEGYQCEEIDDWENPNSKLYRLTDRYGFLHENDVSPELEELDKKFKELEIKRSDKWLKMLKNWKKYFPSDKLTKRIYKGIPEPVRGEVWARLLDVYAVKKENHNIYLELKQWARKYSTELRQIDLDVNRTYRDNVMFTERYGTKQQALFHVLAAYSAYNTEVGYCQGMSQIAALLLMYLNEEDAFWALSQLLTDRRHAMHGFFVPGFPKLHRYQAHLEAILKKFVPKLKKQFDKQDLLPSLYSVKWYFQCFLDRTPFHLTLRLWDIFMLEGDKILTAMSFTILKMFKRELLKMDMERVLTFINKDLEVQGFGQPDDKVVEALKENILELNRARMLYPKIKPSPDEMPKKGLGHVLNEPSPFQTEILERPDEPFKPVPRGATTLVIPYVFEPTSATTKTPQSPPIQTKSSGGNVSRLFIPQADYHLNQRVEEPITTPPPRIPMGADQNVAPTSDYPMSSRGHFKMADHRARRYPTYYPIETFYKGHHGAVESDHSMYYNAHELNPYPSYGEQCDYMSYNSRPRYQTRPGETYDFRAYPGPLYYTESRNRVPSSRLNCNFELEQSLERLKRAATREPYEGEEMGAEMEIPPPRPKHPDPAFGNRSVVLVDSLEEKRVTTMSRRRKL